VRGSRRQRAGKNHLANVGYHLEGLPMSGRYRGAGAREPLRLPAGRRLVYEVHDRVQGKRM